MFSQPKFLGHLPSTRCRFHLIWKTIISIAPTSPCISGEMKGVGQGTVLCPILALIVNIIIIEKQASIKSLIHQNTPRACALGVSQSLPRARGKEALALPVAEKARAPFPQRSKTARISVSPQQFSGTARWTGGPLAVDEVPAKRILDSIVPGLVGRRTVPCPTFFLIPCPFHILLSWIHSSCHTARTVPFV